MALIPAGRYNNKIPRNMKLAGGALASDDFLSRVQSSHDNVFENLPFFAAGVVACVTSGVPLATTSNLAMYWNVVNALYIIVFITPLNNLTDGNARTLCFGTRLAAQAKLFALAAAAASK